MKQAAASWYKENRILCGARPHDAIIFSFPLRHERSSDCRAKKKNILLDKLKESLASVLPITGIVLLLTSTIAPLPVGAMMAFVIGAIMLIFGMALFTLGTEMAMTPLGERVGVVMTKSRNLKIIIPVCFAIGVMITMSEPDLTVLATQVPSIPNMAIILSVAVGVGAFLVVALLRIVIGIRLSNMLVVFYALVFILAFFAPNEFLAVAFDSGGVTTGPMTVPFIMALGVGHLPPSAATGTPRTTASAWWRSAPWGRSWPCWC